MEILDPATLEPIAVVDVAGPAEVAAVCAAAAKASSEWSQSTAAERGRALRESLATLQSHEDELSRLLSREQGKPLPQAISELRGSLRILSWYADVEIPDVVLRETPEQRVMATLRPVGVVGLITPWNFPITILSMKLWATLRAGNTVVIKPAPTTPLTTMRLVELIADHFPAGVLNVVTGGADTGRLLTENPQVDKISFTGSTTSGRHVMASAAATLKRLTLELGGNDPAILLDDVDLDVALPMIARASFHNAGQVCQAIKRVYVPRALHAAAVDRLVESANRFLVLGPGLDEGITIGPVNNAAQRDRVTGLVADAADRGATVIPVGEARTGESPGYFVQPVIVSDVPEDAPLVIEEQFGPALPVVAYDDVDELVGRLNAETYGLDASVWSRDEDRAARVASRLEVGQAYVNTHAGPPDPEIPFGGVKASGFGRELGMRGIEEVSELRLLTIARQAGR